MGCQLLWLYVSWDRPNRQNRGWSSEAQHKGEEGRESQEVTEKYLIMKKKKKRKLGRQKEIEVTVFSQCAATLSCSSSQHGTPTYFHLIRALSLCSPLYIQCHHMVCLQLNQWRSDITQCLRLNNQQSAAASHILYFPVCFALLKVSRWGWISEGCLPLSPAFTPIISLSN